MKIGIGLYPHLLTPETYRFACQAGVTHVVAHLPGFARRKGRGLAPEQMWTLDELAELKRGMNDAGLEFAAIENFDEQMAGLKTLLRNMGQLGIGVMGYNFSYANVWGTTTVTRARGGAPAPGYSTDLAPPQAEIPNGMVWNTVYDKDAPEGTIGTVSEEQIWERYERFLTELVPVAEEAEVRLAMHPADPPLAVINDTARMVTKPEHYQRLLDLVPSHYHAAEFCQGTIAETYTGQGRIAYVHLRNVVGKVPDYYETFIDGGDVDMVKALKLYKKHGFDGIIIPDHSPAMSCEAPWHAGMAYALGWIRGVLATLDQDSA